MTEADVEIIVQRAREKYPDHHTRIISDDGPRFVTYYNEVRLNSAIGYVTPQDMLEGRADQIHAERDRELEEARERRRLARAREAA